MDEFVDSLSEDEAIMLYHKLARKFDWSGTFFTVGDIDSVWRDCMESEHNLENVSDLVPDYIVDDVLTSYEWSHMNEFLCERGFEIIRGYVCSIISGEK